MRTFKVKSVEISEALRQMFHLLDLDARDCSAISANERVRLSIQWQELHSACYEGATLHISDSAYRELCNFADKVGVFGAVMIEIALEPNF